MKRKTSTTLVIKRYGWSYIYAIYDDTRRVIYVGKTINEKRRASAHQRVETSKCKRLAAAIDRLRATTSTWTFAKSYSRVPGLEHGVPEEEADKYEAYFIKRIGGHGTLHSLQNPAGCNMREGNSAWDYESDETGITEALAKLKEGESLFSQADREKREESKKIPLELIEAAAEVDISTSLRRAVEDAETGLVPVCVEEAYQLAVRHHESLSKINETQRRVASCKKWYAKSSTCFVDREEFAKELNGIGSLLNDFLPDADNYRQQVMHKIICTNYKQIVITLHNGEPAKTLHLAPLTARIALDIFTLLDNMLKLRDDAGGVPQHSFSAKMAWCLPHSKLNTTLEKNLDAVNALVADPVLNESQLDKARKRRDDVMRAIKERDAPTACE